MEFFLGIVGLATLLFAFLTWLQGRANERRRLEARDVVWSRELKDDKWQFSHSGSTAISEVKIVLTVNGKSEISTTDELRPLTPLVAESRAHANLLHEVREADAEYEREYEEWLNPEPEPDRYITGFPVAQFLTDPEPMSRMQMNASISARITWRYPSGVPGTHEMTWVEAY